MTTPFDFELGCRLYARFCVVLAAELDDAFAHPMPLARETWDEALSHARQLREFATALVESLEPHARDTRQTGAHLDA